MPNIGLVISCYVCAFFVMLTGSFAVLEYIMAFLEFIFITSVGIMLFPMSMWEGSKFLTEKLISAIIGFSIKLLFCTICIFLLMWGMLSLANGYVDRAFKGLADQILLIIFTSLLFYYICKSAPGLAQSLLTGSPSLSAAGAIGAAKAAAGAVAGVAGLAAKGGGMIAQGGMNLAGGMAKMAGAGKQAAANGGGVGGVLGAMAKSAGGSLLNTAGSAGGSLTRSLLGHSPLMPKGGGAGGYNRNSPAQMFMQANRDGSQKSAGDFFKQQFDRGANPNEYKVAASDGRYQPPQSAAPASAGAAAAATKATTTSHVSSVGSGISAHKTARLSHHRARNRQNPKG
jgi:type IV secretory pathway TrbL component